MRKVGSMLKYKGPSWVYDLTGFFIHWKGKAEELKRASDVVWVTVAQDFNRLREDSLRNINDLSASYNQPNLMDTFVFLAGLCIENILKGFIVIDKPLYISNGRLRGNIIIKHDLCLLAQEANVTLSEEETKFCELASAAITSFGRYPLPKNKSEFKGKIVINADSQLVFNDLYNRLMPEFSDRFKNRKR